MAQTPKAIPVKEVSYHVQGSCPDCGWTSPEFKAISARRAVRLTKLLIVPLWRLHLMGGRHTAFLWGGAAPTIKED